MKHLVHYRIINFHVRYIRQHAVKCTHTISLDYRIVEIIMVLSRMTFTWPSISSYLQYTGTKCASRIHYMEIILAKINYHDRVYLHSMNGVCMQE